MFPMVCRLGPEQAKRPAGDQVALQIEGVVDREKHRQEALGWTD
jgi:hypothetical protein